MVWGVWSYSSCETFGSCCSEFCGWSVNKYCIMDKDYLIITSLAVSCCGRVLRRHCYIEGVMVVLCAVSSLRSVEKKIECIGTIYFGSWNWSWCGNSKLDVGPKLFRSIFGLIFLRWEDRFKPPSTFLGWCQSQVWVKLFFFAKMHWCVGFGVVRSLIKKFWFGVFGHIQVVKLLEVAVRSFVGDLWTNIV